uniref:NADH dehydrogenase subunit 6 n=1 Tax=Virpazaria ripkeni TaxID=2939667 RepID=UPI00202838E5|nr:NADH dehydrogenase subunit 6 [Virpazaria ripkeni]UPV69721.1 NADH dehydrogenase subunit 6 [Virpazaria ripkeni]UPV69734.1 NADH dehydrogenase subunit 6 [Virpazaria ripkeni]
MLSLWLVYILIAYLNTPMAYGGALIFLSLLMSMQISLMMSSWYGFLLFLVYIGGMLILFMYMIMLSSNFVFTSTNPILAMTFSITFLFVMKMSSNYLKSILSVSMQQCSADMMIGLFLALAVLLLLVFFSIVFMILKKNKSIIVIEQN